MRYIYLDAAATTRCRDEVSAAVLDFGSKTFGNPASSHIMGLQARNAVRSATTSVAAMMGCSPEEVTFTSGATEGNNIVILGSIDASVPGVNLVICPIDHKSALEAAKEVERRGVEVRCMKVDRQGRIDLGDLREKIDRNTGLVTLSQVNSEIGTAQDLDEIGEMLAGRRTIFHVDASQAVGKLPIAVGRSRVDSMVISAHKIGGPKGIGALYVASGSMRRLRPLTFGGGQAYLRSGTLPSQLIVGFGVAAERIARADLTESWEQALVRRRLILDRFEHHGIRFLVNSSHDHSVPHILNVSFPAVRSETLIRGLPEVCVASGSACNSHSLAPSYVLTGIGHTDNRANCSIRLSFEADMNVDEVKAGADLIGERVRNLQDIPMEMNVHG